MRVLLFAAILYGFLIAGPADAETVCGPRDALAGVLRADWNEQPVADAVTAQGRHLVLFSAPDGATWSIVVTAPGGASCLIAVGVDWLHRPPRATGAFDPRETSKPDRGIH